MSNELDPGRACLQDPGHDLLDLDRARQTTDAVKGQG
jgi:hypothetical protein